MLLLLLTLLLLLLRLLCLCLVLLSLPAMMLLYAAALGAPTTPGTFPILQAGMLHLMKEEEKGEIGLTTNLLEPVGDSAG